MKEVHCGEGRFVLNDDTDVVTQYDHMGRVVGIFKATDTPTLRQWIIEKAPKQPAGRPNGAVTQNHKQSANRD